MLRSTKLFLRLLNRAIALTAITVSTVSASTQEPHSARIKISETQHLNVLASGDPESMPVVFVHGTPGGADGWMEYLRSVPPGFFYLAVDRPGFGASSPDDAVTSLRLHAAAVSALLHTLKQPAILVGHSLGGPVIARTAVDNPKAVAGLLILAGSLDPTLEDVPFIQYMGNTWPVSSLLPRAIRNANREIISLKDELLQLQPMLAQIKLPTIVIHGTKDDLVPFANVEYIRSRFANAQPLEIVELQGQNHFLPWNSKSFVDQALLRLKERLITRPAHGLPQQ